MTDVYLQPGETNPKDVRLFEPGVPIVPPPPVSANDVFLYVGESNPADVKLRSTNPTVPT